MIPIGVKMRLTHLRLRRHNQVGDEGMERLSNDVAHPRDDVRSLREESVDLCERIEFAERVLAPGAGGWEPERPAGRRGRLSGGGIASDLATEPTGDRER